MPELHDLSPPPGSKPKKKRVGRGRGSGKGKRAGRGQDGQGSRSGGSVPAWFEGGQMPLQRRIPKRGFKNFNRVEYQGVNVREFSRLEVGEVTPEVLKDRGIIRSLKKPVKILGTGEVESAFQVTAHAFSAAARKKIEDAGGSVTVLGGPAADEAVPAPEGEEAPETEDEKA